MARGFGLRATAGFQFDFNLIGGVITFTPSAGAIIIAIKTPAGFDPSVSAPVEIPFIGTDGEETITKITGPLSLTISSGSTLGAVNDRPFRIWVVAILDSSGVVHLGAINCFRQSASDGRYIVVGLNDQTVQTSFGGSTTSAEGGAGAADNAGIMYTTTATTGQMRILGYASWSDGLNAVGTWDVEPSVNQLYASGSPRPGDMLQRSESIGSNLGVSTFTFAVGGAGAAVELLPIDDTIPQYDEGSFWGDVSLGPTAAENYIEIEAEASLSPDAANEYVAIMAGYANEQAEGIAYARSQGANIPVNVRLSYIVPNAFMLPLTRQFCVGYSATGTVTMNGVSGVRRFGGVLKSWMRITERMG